MTARHVIFKGHVQGVGFRYTCRDLASRSSVTGFVRNLPDGTVEMLAQGTPAEIQALIEEIQDHFNGYLRDTRTTERPVDPRYADFRIAY